MTICKKTKLIRRATRKGKLLWCVVREKLCNSFSLNLLLDEERRAASRRSFAVECRWSCSRADCQACLLFHRQVKAHRPLDKQRVALLSQRTAPFSKDLCLTSDTSLNDHLFTTDRQTSHSVKGTYAFLLN